MKRTRFDRVRVVVSIVIFVLLLLAAGGYTVLVKPKRFVQCLGAPVDFLVRSRGTQINLPLPAFVGGNQATLLANGHQALPAMLDLVNRAQRNIRWQVMLFQPDDSGMRVAEALIQAARRGVQVQLSFDIYQSANGSAAFPLPPDKLQRFRRNQEKMLSDLRGAGATVLDNGTRLDYPLEGLSQAAVEAQSGVMRASCIEANHFDHRKLLIVDDQTAIIGGMNVGNEYVFEFPIDLTRDQQAEMDKRQRQGLPEAWEKWQDVSAQVQGPIVAALAREFNWRWEVLGGQPLPVVDNLPAAGELAMRFVAQRPDHPQVSAAYLDLINHAQRNIYVAHAYPTYAAALSALMAASRRGVRVTIVFPNKYNDETTARIFHSFIRPLTDAGVQVYLNDRHMAHSKVMQVDGRWSVIGSFNLTYRSFEHDLESVVIVDSEPFARQVQQNVIQPYLDMSSRVTAPPAEPLSIQDRFMQWFY